MDLFVERAEFTKVVDAENLFFEIAQDIFHDSRHFLHFEVAMHDAIADNEIDKVLDEDQLRDMINVAWDELSWNEE